MKNLLFGLLATTLLLFTACDPDNTDVETCDVDNVGYLTVVNNTTDGSMDIYLIDSNNSEEYIATIAPGGQTAELVRTPDTYRVEGREPNGIRLWEKDNIDLMQCDELFVSLP